MTKLKLKKGAVKNIKGTRKHGIAAKRRSWRVRSQVKANGVQKENQGESNNMTELFSALTALVKEATTYLARQNGTHTITTTSVPTSAPIDGSDACGVTDTTTTTTAEAPAAVEKVKRGRKPKAAAPVEAAIDPEDPFADLNSVSEAPAAKKEPTEAEIRQGMMDVATEFVAKFGKVDGPARIKKAMVAKFGTDKFPKLTVDQVVKLTELMRGAVDKAA